MLACALVAGGVFAQDTVIPPNDAEQEESAGPEELQEDPAPQKTAGPTDDDAEPAAEDEEPSLEETTAEEPALVALLPFDGSIQPEPVVGFEIPVRFERPSAAFANGKEYGPNEPRFVEGMSGKAILLEEGRANFLSRNQSNVEAGLEGFVSVNNASLQVYSDDSWEGSQALSVTAPGENVEEGFLVQAVVKTVFYNGLHIVPTVYVGSFYAKGSGYLQMILKDPDTGNTGDPLFFDLSDEWQRFSCLFTSDFEPIRIGRNLQDNWKEHLPEETRLETKLQLICTTTDKQQVSFLVDGLLLEQRHRVYPRHGSAISPLSWIPGETEVAQETLTLDTKNDFFNKWRQNGTISFWFKPYWDPRDGTRETLLHIGPGPAFLDHVNARVRLSHANISFVPYQWKNEWQHIAIVWDSEGKHSLYIDGYEYPSEEPFDRKATFLAFHSGNTTPNGVLDDLALFQNALGTEEIRAIASERRPLKP